MDGGRILQIGPPSELYDEPASLKVAQFIGSPAINVLPAVTEAAGALLLHGRRCRWRSRRPRTVGQLAIRPEALRLGPAGALADPFALAGRVRRIEHHGAERIVMPSWPTREAAPSSPVCPKAKPRMRRCATGAAVAITFDPTRAHVFDMDGRPHRGVGVRIGRRADARMSVAAAAEIAGGPAHAALRGTPGLGRGAYRAAPSRCRPFCCSLLIYLVPLCVWWSSASPTTSSARSTGMARPRQFREGAGRRGVPALAVQHVPLCRDRAAGLRPAGLFIAILVHAPHAHPLVLRGRLFPAGDVDADRDGDRVAVHPAPAPRARSTRHPKSLGFGEIAFLSEPALRSRRSR